MHDTLLRVLVLALGLLTYPKDDPSVEEWGHIINTVGMQKHEERLPRGHHQLDQEVVTVDEKMTHTGNKSPQYEITKEQNQADQQVTEKEQMSVLEEGTFDKQEEDIADHKLQEGGRFMLSLSQNSKSEPETDLKASGQKANLLDDKKSTPGEDIQSYGSIRDISTPQGQREKPEGKKVISSNEHLDTETSENETSEKDVADRERDYLWYIWNTFSIISMIRFFRKYLGKHFQMTQGETRAFPGTCTATGVPLPDSQTLQCFHSKCIQVSSNKMWREEFLEGFASDLLYTMRAVCDRKGGMVIEDFQMVDVCDIMVPVSPPDPYRFQCLLWNNQPCDLLPDMQVCGQINLVEDEKIQNGCLCQSPDADDVVCLLHCESEKKTKFTDVCNDLLCANNSAFLSKSQVTRWFQNTIKQAWAQISHKYEFELIIRYVDAPGALVVRFRSGKKISFNINPIVQFNTIAHFFIPSCSPNNLDTFWALSLTKYEDHLLEHISKRLPEHSCHSQTLEIALFLLRRQTALSGSSALKDFHFKTALIHLLLTEDPSQWKPHYVACRLRDLLYFMERSLEKKLLPHALIGNPLTQKGVQLPAEFTGAKKVNLFHPLVAHDCIYRNAVLHFQEMLRNTHVLIHDYVDKCIELDGSL